MDKHVDRAGGGAGRVLLTTTWSDSEASVIRQLLETYDIPCQVISDVPHTVFPLSVDGLGEIRILVAEDQIDTARDVLAEHLRDGLSVLDGGSPSAEGEDEVEGEGEGE